MSDFKTFLQDFMKDEDVWNMSLERYNYLKAMATEIYQTLTATDNNSFIR